MPLTNANVPGTLKDVKSYLDGIALVGGSFHVSGSEISGAKGVGFNVTRVGSGSYTVNFSGSYNREVSAYVYLHLSASTTDRLHVVSQPYQVAEKTMAIETFLTGVGGTVSEMAAHDHNKINFMVMFKTLNSKDGSGL